MRVWRCLTAALGLTVVMVGLADAAEIYNYTVRHPTFGDIGTYTDRVEHDGDQWRIETTLHIMVRVLGVVAHREDASRVEIWRAGRLVSFRGLTTTNGKPLEIAGDARADGFAVTTSTGTTIAPIDVMPSDPWQAARTETLPPTCVMLSTKTGRLASVVASGGQAEQLSLHGIEISVRHYVFRGDRQQDVWIDPAGIPVRFRSVESDVPIDFELSPEALASHVAALK
jgi:Family of unknown function (DUF6134)